MNFLLEFLGTDYVALFIIIGLGLQNGRIRIGGVSFDSSAVIFIAMLYGYLLRSRGIEFTFPEIIQQIGLLLFIFTIGMQAGPSFFEVFKNQGVRLIILAGLTVLIGAITSAILSYTFDIDPTISVGLFTGALTSTPVLQLP